MRAFMKPQIGHSPSGLTFGTSFTRRTSSRRHILFFCCLVFLLLLGRPQNGSAFVLNGYHWPSGAQIAMHLQLDRPPVAFQDGSASWNASAADALTIWN